MRYPRAVEKAFIRSPVSVFKPFQPQRLRISLRYSSTSTRTGTLEDLNRGEVLTGRTDIDMEKVDTTDRLTRLRELMQKHKVDIYSM
jgi:hypothetical protein